MSQVYTVQDADRLRITINGEEVDPAKFKGRRGSRGGGCGGWSCFGCVLTLVIGGSILIGVMGFVSAVFNVNIPFMNQIMTALTGVEAPQTQPLTTDANNFDPFVGLAQAQALAGEGAQLVSIDATYVRSDGTMDLNATYSPAPRVTYDFVRQVERPKDAPPVGVAGSTLGPWYEPITIEAYEPGQRRHVSIRGGNGSVEFDYVNEGMVKETDDPTTNLSGEIVEAPTCTAQALWKEALKKDAPRDAVAIIEYDEDGYTFNISGVLYLRFGTDCKIQE